MMGWKLRFVLLAVVGLSVATGASARLDHEAQTRLLNEANDAFRQGNELLATDRDGAMDNYEKATLRLERIIREGEVENGKLYYNLGNIWFQRGDLGRALLNYLRAEQYMPNDFQLQQNLNFVRQKRIDSFKESEKKKVLKTLFFWHYDFASQTRLSLFTVSFLLLWILAAARLFWKRRELNVAIALFGAFSGLLFLSLSIEAAHYRNNPRGIVVAEESVGRKGDGENYRPSFSEPLHAGTEFTLRDDRGTWVEIVLPDEQTCWVKRSDVALVRDKFGDGN